MQRQFTVDVGRFKQGQHFDYPLQTWEQIARNAGKKLDAITCDVIPGQPPVRKTTKRKAKGTDDAAASHRN